MTVRRARVILNPAAGRDTAPDHAEAILKALHGRYDSLEFALTAAPGDAEKAARQAVADRCEHVFVGGGDGTLNEVLNGIGSTADGLASTTVGVLPLGTGNDFAQALGIPPAIDDALEVVKRGATVGVDVGDVNGRLFVNASAGGFIAEVSEAVTPQMKTLAGRLAYLVGGAQALLDFDPVHTLATDDRGRTIADGPVYAFAVCNSRLIGGGRLIAPEAMIDDGLLDVCIIDAMPTVEFVALLRRVSGGGHVEDPRVRYRQTKQATLEFARPLNVNTDGELLEATRCVYRVRPAAATFFAGDAPFAAPDAKA